MNDPNSEITEAYYSQYLPLLLPKTKSEGKNKSATLPSDVTHSLSKNPSAESLLFLIGLLK
jgi:hypothetical protein